MRAHQAGSRRWSKGLVVVLLLALAGLLLAPAHERGVVQASAPSQGKIEASIFSYDGHDFIRTTTTLVTEDGASAVNTKLDHGTPAFDALVHKRSFTGDATLFGQEYAASYAPLTGKKGELTGALFVGVAK